ncbi:hypothetical protein ACFWU5_27195 [Nocardia sp. NPDC058640]|uniref:hypothetical protein n=1 Tax=Nocardia sp. NPDC058640 TaxID=3346571 RepID=UPI00364D4317
MSDIGVAVVQYPGETDEDGGDVSIHVGSVTVVPADGGIGGRQQRRRHCRPDGGKPGAPA